jgi:hypothetical protein
MNEIISHAAQVCGDTDSSYRRNKLHWLIFFFGIIFRSTDHFIFVKGIITVPEYILCPLIKYI